MTLELINNKEIMLAALKLHELQKLVETALTPPPKQSEKHECLSAAVQFSQTHLCRPRARSQSRGIRKAIWRNVKGVYSRVGGWGRRSAWCSCHFNCNHTKTERRWWNLNHRSLIWKHSEETMCTSVMSGGGSTCSICERSQTKGKLAFFFFYNRPCLYISS